MTYKNPQEWLNYQYSNKEQVKEINLNNLSELDFEQVGELIIDNYPNLRKIDGKDISNLTKLTINNCSQLGRINVHYLKNLQQLILNKLPNLNWLSCSENNLNTLDLSNCANLQWIYCFDNQLTEIKLPKGKKIVELNLRNNNLNQDLSFLSGLVNLEGLNLNNNELTGSLEFLKDMGKLRRLYIRDTDIESGLEHLPDSVEYFYCSVSKRKNAKCQTIYNLFADEEGKVEKVYSGYIKDFSQKLQAFKNLTSGNNQEIDQFIRKRQFKGDDLRWIPYDKFTNIKYLTDGGFSKVYKATLLYTESRSSGTREVALKSLNNSQEMIADFLQEIVSHNLFNKGKKEESRNYQIVWCHGISKDPATGNHLMVVDYVSNGNLRQYLKSCYDKLDFKNKIFQLMDIIRGLSHIHEQGLVHRDFHAGNILNKGICNYISDLGLCRPVNEKDSNKVYGVLPYVAPEVLEGKPYAQASDIYSFGMIVWEMFTGLPPHYDKTHDAELILRIYCGLRPNLDNIQVPQLLKDLINKCWDANPDKRPTASELFKVLNGWYKDIFGEIETAEFYQQYKEIKRIGGFSQNIKYPVYQIHPSAIYTSKLLDTTKLRSFLQFRSSLTSIDFLDLNLKSNNLSHHLTLTIESSNKEKYHSQDLNFDIETNKFDQKTKNLTEKTKRQLSLETQIKTNQGEVKLSKVDEESNYHSEPIEIDYSTNNWQNIHPNFTSQLTQSWINHNFTYQQAQDWLNIGLNPQDYNFANFLKNQKNLTPEKVLNEYNFAELKQEFLQSQQTTQIIQPNLPNWQNK